LKILDKYLLKSFLVPFFATFFVVLFVLVMQALWLQFDKIAGRGLGADVILKFFNYTALSVVPMALSIGILLSSIMALGNLSENYEFAAIKSSGISLLRILRPLLILMVALSALNFLFLNYVFPYATFESKNLLINMKKKQPALALVAGSFNNEIKGFSIKFSEKYGEENNLLKDVLIYDLSKKTYNNKLITAKYGEITTTEGSKYMTLILKDGYYHEDIIQKRRRSISKDEMPFIKSHFDEHQINFDISAFDNFDEDKKHSQIQTMLSLKEIDEKIVELIPPLEKHIKTNSKRFFFKAQGQKLVKDTLKKVKLKTEILNEFSDKNKVKILKSIIGNISIISADLKGIKRGIYNKQEALNRYKVEYHRRIAFSFACLVLFLIGAPLGSIIRKGGFGVPMIIAIIIFVVYYFIGILAEGMAKSGKISNFIGGWTSTIIMVPFGLLLLNKAIKDKNLFDVNTFFSSIGNFFKRIIKFRKSKDLA
jgi:lipopolysaccharide export system permease protein